MTKPSITSLRQATGISQSYASMILTGKRTPPLELSALIFRETGFKIPSVASISDASLIQIASLVKSSGDT